MKRAKKSRPARPAKKRAARAPAKRSPARLRYRCHVVVPRSKKLRVVEFTARDDKAALAYCGGLLKTRLPKGARPMRLERIGSARPGTSGTIAGRRPRQKNPAPTARELAQAERAFERFTGHQAKAIEQHFLPRESGAAWALGPVPEIHYIATRNGETVRYVHKFRAKSRPLLAASSDGSMLYLLGGAYSVTDRGIVDDP